MVVPPMAQTLRCNWYKGHELHLSADCFLTGEVLPANRAGGMHGPCASVCFHAQAHLLIEPTQLLVLAIQLPDDLCAQAL